MMVDLGLAYPQFLSNYRRKVWKQKLTSSLKKKESYGQPTTERIIVSSEISQGMKGI